MIDYAVCIIIANIMVLALLEEAKTKGSVEEHARIAPRRVISITANRRLMRQLKRKANEAI